MLSQIGPTLGEYLFSTMIMSVNSFFADKGIFCFYTCRAKDWLKMLQL